VEEHEEESDPFPFIGELFTEIDEITDPIELALKK